MSEELVNELKELKKTMSYEQIAQMLGVTLLSVRNWINGNTKMSVGYETLVRMRLSNRRKK